MKRDAFLGAVRSAASSARLPLVEANDPGLLVPDLSDDDLIERFTAALERADGSLHTEDPIETILEIAAGLDADRYLGWDDDHLPVAGLVDALAARGLTRTACEIPMNAQGRLAHQADYIDVRLGVTGAEAGFAETGTIVVRSGSGRPRMASLIPTVHIALLPRSEIRRSLAHWAAEAPVRMATAANVVFITGPSRTGDIEMRLNTGVHGPKEVHVVLI